MFQQWKMNRQLLYRLGLYKQLMQKKQAFKSANFCSFRDIRVRLIKNDKQQQSLVPFRQVSGRSGQTVARGPLGWASLGLFLMTGTGIVLYVRYLKEEKEKAKVTEQKKSVGMAALGGPFNLIDHTGKARSDQDFLGQWVLLYFGFCHCPDICPDQLDKMTEIVNELDETPGLPTIQPLYITVDPDRDTVETVAEYIKEFHPRLIGLTGTLEQIKDCCKHIEYIIVQVPKMKIMITLLITLLLCIS